RSIVRSYGAGEGARESGIVHPYMALEYCPGGSLAERLDGTPLPPRLGAQLVEGLARALHVAHEAGIVHRDLKPANVLLASSGREPPADPGTKTARHHLAGRPPQPPGLSPP